MPMVIGIDHGYYAIKGASVCFPTGTSVYDYEPYTVERRIVIGTNSELF